MNDEELHIRFLKAFDAANAMENIEIPIDLRLQFYAYYKQATISSSNFYNPNDPVDIRNAFKMNAILQVKDLTPNEAKLAYIKLVNQTLIKYKINHIKPI
ncbi:acyl-CoA-binding protein [Pseudofulvibacter geojedonensis]|uniref:Acyl-CoA-binding protein n=1 Tax=Pseudofulvibacter geojedonensis TaxID=1123758 RepID=A0ABW3I5Q3_9FLAO